MLILMLSMNAYLVGASDNKEKSMKELIVECRKNQKETVELLLRRYQFDLAAPKLSKKVKNVSAFAYHPTDNYAAMSYYGYGDDYKIIQISNLETEQEIAQLQGHKKNIWTLAFNGDGIQLASGDEEGAVYLWDVRTWKAAGQLQIPQKKYRHPAVDRLWYNPKKIAQLLVFQSLDRITIWDTDQRQQVDEKKGCCVAFNTAGTECAIGHKTGLELYDTVTWDLLKKINFYRDLSSIVYHPEDGRLTVGCCSNYIGVQKGYIGVQKGEEFERIELPGGGAWPLVAYSPEGEKLIVIREKHIHICNTIDEQKQWLIDDDMGVALSTAYHPTKKQFALLSKDAYHIWRKEPVGFSTLRIFDIPDYKEVIAPLNLVQANYVVRQLETTGLLKRLDLIEEFQQLHDSLPERIQCVISGYY